MEAQGEEAQGGNTNITICGSHNVFGALGKPTWIGIPIVLNEDGQFEVCSAQVAEAPCVSNDTGDDLARLISLLNFFQSRKCASKGTDNGVQRFRFYAYLYNCNRYESILREDSPSNRASLEWFVTSLKDKCMNDYNVRKYRRDMIVIKGCMYNECGGIDEHPDNRSETDNFLFWVRLVISIGAPAEIEVKAKLVHFKHTFSPKPAFSGPVCTITTNTAHVYAMSDSGCGRNAVLFTKKDKSEAIQLFHCVVKALPRGGGLRAALMIDMPFDTREEQSHALDTIESKTWELPPNQPFSMPPNKKPKYK